MLVGVDHVIVDGVRFILPLGDIDTQAVLEAKGVGRGHAIGALVLDQLAAVQGHFPISGVTSTRPA